MSDGWKPEEQAWKTYINFEERYKEIDRARRIYERFVIVHPQVKNWIKYAKFEEIHGFIHGSRSVFERAVEFFGEEYMDEKLFIAFANFEENQKEHDRAPGAMHLQIRSGIEEVIVSKRIFQYEESR